MGWTKQTETVNKDGSKTTIIEKHGFVVRDGIIALVGTAAGVAMGGVTVPIIAEVLPEAIKASNVASKLAIGLGSFTVSEVTAHSVSRAMSEGMEFVDGIKFDVFNKDESSNEPKAETGSAQKVTKK